METVGRVHKSHVDLTTMINWLKDKYLLYFVHKHHVVVLTGGTAAAQVSDSSLPPSAPAAALLPPKGTAPPVAPRSPGTTLVSRDEGLVSCDTDMASSAVVAAAGDRVSPIFKGANGERRELKRQSPSCQSEPIGQGRHTYRCTLCLFGLLSAGCRRLISLWKSVIEYLLAASA